MMPYPLLSLSLLVMWLLLNDFTLVRAVIGLHRYVAKYLVTQNSGASWNTKKNSAKGIRQRAASHLPRVMAFT